MCLTELEHDLGALRLLRRLGEGTRKQGGSPCCVAHGERVASSVAEQRHRPRIRDRLGVHHLRRDLTGGRRPLAQDPGGTAM